MGASTVGGTIGLIVKEYDHSLLLTVTVIGSCLFSAFYIANTISAKCRELREGELNYFVAENQQFFTSAPYTNFPNAQATFRIPNPMTLFQRPPPVIAPTAQPFNKLADLENGLLIQPTQQSSVAATTKIASISRALKAF